MARYAYRGQSAWENPMSQHTTGSAYTAHLAFLSVRPFRPEPSPKPWRLMRCVMPITFTQFHRDVTERLRVSAW